MRTIKIKGVLATLMLLAGVAACSSDSVTGIGSSGNGSIDASGTYVLQTFNGGALPYTFINTSGNNETVVSDTIVVRSDNTATEVGHHQTDTNGTMGYTTIVHNGTYDIAGSPSQLGYNVTFRFTDGVTETGTFSGTASQANDGMLTLYTGSNNTSVYMRQ